MVMALLYSGVERVVIAVDGPLLRCVSCVSYAAKCIAKPRTATSLLGNAMAKAESRC